MFGDLARPELIDRIGLDRASALVLTMDDPVLTRRLTRRVRAAFPDLTIVARARDPAHAAKLYRAGATDAVPETLESSLQLSEAVLVDLGLAMGPVIASIHQKRAELRAQIMEMGQLAQEPAQLGTRLRDSKTAINSRAECITDGLHGVGGFAPVRTAALRHVGPAAAALPADRLDRLADEVEPWLSNAGVDLVRKAVEAVGGQGGGGRPDMAQGGGRTGQGRRSGAGGPRRAQR